MKQGDVLESFMNNFGGDDLDITNNPNNDYNVDSLQGLLEEVQRDQLLGGALSNGIDIKEYNKSIESDLSKLDRPSLDINQSTELASLHTKIRASDKLLQDMGSILKIFEGDLRAVSADIESLQQHSRNLAQQLTNRRVVRDAVANTIQRLVISPDLINGLSGDVNEGYIKFLMDLDAKLHSVYDLNGEDVAAAVDLFSTLDALRLMSVRKLRDFMLSLVYSLRKPKTNIQILQHNVLIKYAYFNKFMFVHSPVFAMEIRDHYIETVTRTFANYFGSYLVNLSKLQHQIGTAADLLGKDESQSAVFGTQKKSKSKSTIPKPQYSIDNENSPKLGKVNGAQYDPTTHGPTHISRANILLTLDSAPAIIPHVAIQAGVKYSYEALFRSMLRLLVDTISSEHLFIVEWFPKQILHGSQGSPHPDQLFLPIFGKCLGLLQDNLLAYLPQCYDPIGVLLLIKIAQHALATMEFRNIQIPPFTSYLQHLIGLLWERFNKLLESVRAALSKYAGAPPKDIRPNSVVRRYAEFLASLLVLNNAPVEVKALPSSPRTNTLPAPPFLSLSHQSPPPTRRGQAPSAGDQRVTAWLTVLRTAIEKLLDNISVPLEPRPRPVFLINNFDLILSVLRERGVDTETGDDGSRFRYNLKVETAVFVEEELHYFYPKLIDFVKVLDSKLLKDPNSPIDKDVVEQLSKEFAANWKEVLSKINTDVMTYFPNFELGSDILKKVLSQLILYYKRFEEIHRKCFRTSSSNPAQPDSSSPQPTPTPTPVTTGAGSNTGMGKSLVPISTITYEITKKYSSFS